MGYLLDRVYRVIPVLGFEPTLVIWNSCSFIITCDKEVFL